MEKIPVISIVDDDESVRIAMENLVRSCGYMAQTYDSADQFLSSSEVGRTSCLISDVQMPRMNGLELLDVLRARGHCMPIIFITAFPSPAAEARARNAGAVCFLIKPFVAKTLIGCLESALKGLPR